MHQRARIGRRWAVLAASLLALAALPGAALAAPPANDDIADRIDLTGETMFTGTNVDATREAGEPHNLASDAHSVWYGWTAPASGLWTFDLCGPNTAFNTTMAAYTGTPFDPLPPSSFRQRRVSADLARCGDAADASTSAITIDAMAGVEYKISIAGAFAGATGSFKGAIHRGPNTNLLTTAEPQAGFVQGELAAAPLAVGAGGGASVQCSLDGAAYVPCAPDQRYEGLADGPHTLRVKAAAGGFEDPSPAVSVFTVDRTPPDTQYTSFSQPGTGAELEFGSTEGAGAFECSFDGTRPATCESPLDFDGLCAGAHSFSIRARDHAFNIDPTPALRQFTTPAGAPACGNPSLDTQPAVFMTGYSAVANAAVDANGGVVVAYFEYGTTTAYGARTSPQLFAGATPGTLSDIVYGRPDEVLHYRAVARTASGLVFVGGDRTVTLEPAEPGAPELQLGTPAVTATTIALPYTARYDGPDDVVVGALYRAGDAAERRWAALRRLPGDGAEHSGTLRLTGLPPDTRTEVIAAVAVVDASERSRLEPPIVAHTAKLPPSAEPQQPAPADPVTPQPAAPAARPAIERLGFGASKLRRLRRGRWEARVLCNDACRVRFRLKARGSVIAKATVARASAGTASVQPKLTRKGRAKLRGKRRVRATLIARALGPQLTLKRRLTFR
jgi:hypothetical protein